MGQMTKREAIAFAESGEWKKLSHAERAVLGLSQRRLCMPFDVMHEAVEKATGRPVWSHEFARPEKLLGEIASGDHPSFDEVMAPIADKAIFLVDTKDKTE